MIEELKQILQFSHYITALKNIQRFRGQCYWKDYPEQERYESVADHTWRVGILIILLEKYFTKPFDLSKALKMTLIHDIPEIIAGDSSPMGEDGTGKNTYAFSNELSKQRFEHEKKAAKKIFSKLPDELSHDLFSTWLEYEKQEAFEAKLVKVIDHFEATIQVFDYQKGHLFKKHLNFNLEYIKKNIDIEPVLTDFYNLIAKELSENYKEVK